MIGAGRQGYRHHLSPTSTHTGRYSSSRHPTRQHLNLNKPWATAVAAAADPLCVSCNVCIQRLVQLALLCSGPKDPGTQMVRIGIVPGINLGLLSCCSLRLVLPGVNNSLQPLLHAASMAQALHAAVARALGALAAHLINPPWAPHSPDPVLQALLPTTFPLTVAAAAPDSPLIFTAARAALIITVSVTVVTTLDTCTCRPASALVTSRGSLFLLPASACVSST